MMHLKEYESFLTKKEAIVCAAGFEQVPPLLPTLFPFQRDIVAWALRRGRAAVFADCGLGKTIVQLEWAKHVADHTRGRVLIFAPLAVAQQTVAEGCRFGIRVDKQAVKNLQRAAVPMCKSFSFMLGSDRADPFDLPPLDLEENGA